MVQSKSVEINQQIIEMGADVHKWPARIVLIMSLG
jgi:hypothetical protein